MEPLDIKDFHTKTLDIATGNWDSANSDFDSPNISATITAWGDKSFQIRNKHEYTIYW